MSEAVRLVIWDLDETFWRGTLVEGGIELDPRTIGIVLELNRRGIMSSVCSKNTLDKVRPILEQAGVWDSFVFPSIDWNPKGPRIARQIERIQLRPASVLFIDDNPLNLHEALHFVPELQVASPSLIDNLLLDERFKGKQDPGLSRLAQYKLLEQRAAVEDQYAGDVEDFLRASDIRVMVDYDVEANIDRAVELINRTNQLNFTKRRLPEDPEQARAELRSDLARFNVQAGLVRVMDRFGDYGFVGFYLQEAMLSGSRLVHYCWSCRTLGMGVETWLYERMERPRLKVVGEVLADLSRPGPAINWIRQVEVLEADPRSAQPNTLGRVLIRGGCDLEPLAHYFRMVSKHVDLEVNLLRAGMEIRNDHSIMFRHALECREAGELAQGLGYVPSDFHTEASGQAHDIWILSFWADAAFPLYQAGDLLLPFAPAGLGHHDILGMAEQDVLDKLDGAEQNAAYRVLQAGFTTAGLTGGSLFKANLARFLASTPPSTLVFISLADEAPPPGAEMFRERHARLNRWVREVAGEHPRVRLLSIREFIEHEDEVEALNHFHRMVYYRLFRRVIELAQESLPSAG